MNKYTTPEMNISKKVLRANILAGSNTIVTGKRSVGTTTGLENSLSGAGQDGKFTSGTPFFEAL